MLGAIVAAFMIVSRRPTTSLTAIPEKSIAVLPFVNMSEDKANEYFSDGISEELLNLLAKIPQLQVTARTSSFSFKGKEVAIPEIARTLHVAHVLEGSVRKAGNSVRITAQLIKAGDRHAPVVADLRPQARRHLRDPGRDRGRRGEAAQGHAARRGAEGAHDRSRGVRAVPAGRPARTAGHRRRRTSSPTRCIDKVLAIDPRYAPAWVGLSRNFLNETNQGLLSNKGGYAQAREAATKALAIDPDYAPAHASLGWIAMYGDNDLAAAAQHFKRALALDPTNLGVLRNSANAARISRPPGRGAGARRGRRAPRSGERQCALQPGGVDQRCAGRLDAAIASFRTVLSLAPGRGAARFNLGVALLLKGDAQGALAEIEQETSEIWKMIGLPMAYHALGRKADSDAALAALIAKCEKDGPYNIAYVYAYRGEADKAFEWLDKAVEYGDPGVAEIVTENLFDKIHADPRWLPFLRKIGKAPEQLAKIEFKVTLPQ